MTKTTSGIELRVERTRARARQIDVAKAAGLSRQRISQLESLEKVPQRQVERYLAAVRELSASAA